MGTDCQNDDANPVIASLVHPVVSFQLNRVTFTERIVCHTWNSSFQIVDKRPNVAFEKLRCQRQVTRWQTTRSILTHWECLMTRQCCHQNMHTKKLARHDVMT